MCIGSPKVPKSAMAASQQQIPIRQPVLLPDNGDTSVIGGLKSTRRLTTSAMILAGKGGTLGSPSVTGPLGAPGY